MADIQIEGLDALVAKFGELQGGAYMREVLTVGGTMLKNFIAQYPLASEANTPYQRRWYERGYGPKWMRKDGSVKGLKTSETLGRKWSVVARSDTEVVVGNNASYAPFVQSAEKQANFHRQRGWRTDDMAIKETAPKIVAMAQREIDRILGGG